MCSHREALTLAVHPGSGPSNSTVVSATSKGASQPQRPLPSCPAADRPAPKNQKVTSPSGNTIYTLKGNSGENIEFKAPRGGTYRFCFHNPYGAPATVSLFIHVGRIPNEHNLGKHGRNPEEEAMKKRFDEWMARHHRTYKDEEEKARRYMLFRDCASRVDKLNALGDGVTYKTNDFCDRSEEEMRPYHSAG
uniref:Uncharacterized protein n=1 Tax=Avena sativa TaxID=4498 RepID=A0ACD5UNT8_AVESA